MCVYIQRTIYVEELMHKDNTHTYTCVYAFTCLQVSVKTKRDKAPAEDGETVTEPRRTLSAVDRLSFEAPSGWCVA